MYEKVSTKSKFGKNGKYTFQNIIEAILFKHGLPEKDLGEDWYLKIQNKPYTDLVMEKIGATITAGHYRKENNDLISDPILVFDYNNGQWYPVDLEQVPVFIVNVGSFSGITRISTRDNNGNRLIFKKNKESFDSFQRMFARNIVQQGFLDDDVVIAEKKFPAHTNIPESPAPLNTIDMLETIEITHPADIMPLTTSTGKIIQSNLLQFTS
jgi:hypothetical protein